MLIGAFLVLLQLYNVPLRAGDIVVAATDGVWDNVYPDECAAVVSQVASRGDKPAVAAAALAHISHLRCEQRAVCSDS